MKGVTPIFRIIGYCCLALGLMLPFDAPVRGEDFRNALSLQGFTGLLNTPNAAVTDEGHIAGLYTQQIESQWRDRVQREDSYLFSVGLFSFAEIGSRLIDAPPDIRDLSAHFKVKIPFIPPGYHLPDIAFGMQDTGGGAKFLQTKYLVATESWHRFRVSLGFGTGPDRMKGLFGGLELKTFDWLYLLGENDTKETNLGIRLITPKIFGLPINLQVIAKTALDYQPGKVEFGIGLQFPLGSERHNNEPPPERSEERADPWTDKRTAHPAPGPPFPVPEKASGRSEAPVRLKDGLWLLQQKLAGRGFQNIRIGADEDGALLVVVYENASYNHNELDALGVVLGTIMDTLPSGFEVLQIVIKKKNIPVLQLTAPLENLRKFYQDPEEMALLNADLEITPEVVIDDEISFIAESANPSWLKSELMLTPAIKTFVATEVKNIDYLLSLKPDYFLNLWKGAVLNARWDIPLDWSENFDDGQVFRDNRRGSQFERLMFFQALKITPRLMLNLGGGMFLHETYGAINDLVWTPGSGNHRWELKQAHLTSSDNQALYGQNDVYLGAYRYYFSPLDLYLEGTAGQFLDQDRGFMLKMKRFFGDTAFSVYFKDSRTAAHEHVQVVGLQIALPLTPRRDMKPYALQVKGPSEWSYAQETKVVAPGAANSVNTSIGVDPQTSYSLERVFYNRDRLSEEYIRRHLPRLRDAYLIYR